MRPLKRMTHLILLYKNIRSSTLIFKGFLLRILSFPSQDSTYVLRKESPLLDFHRYPSKALCCFFHLSATVLLGLKYEFLDSCPHSTLVNTSQVALMVKNLLAKAGDIRDTGSIPRWGRSLEEENGNLLQYSCLENPMDRGAWHPTVHRVSKNWT